MKTISTNQFQVPQSRLLLHGLFWIGVVLLLTYTSSLFAGEIQRNLLYMLSILPVQMLAAYFLVYWQIPNWLNKGSWIKFLFGSAAVAYLFGALARVFAIYIAEPLMGIDGIDESLWEILTDPIYLIRVYLPTAYLPAVFFFLFKMTKENYAKENKLVALEKEKKTAELNFLKAQINPHFLFNTLNNIYALSKKKSEETPEMILKLSEILDYTIYECNVDRVPLSREWELIENYADLQALRHQDQMTIVMNQDIQNEKAYVAPLILISLVENAFKHGLKGRREGAIIDVSLLEKNGELIFKIYNTRNEKSSTNNRGIGLKNLKRQLELQYAKRYSLEVVEKDTSYLVTLKLNLK